MSNFEHVWVCQNSMHIPLFWSWKMQCCSNGFPFFFPGSRKCDQISMECFACGAKRWNQKLYFWCYCAGTDHLRACAWLVLFFSYWLSHWLNIFLFWCDYWFLVLYFNSLISGQLSSNEASFRSERLYVNKLNIILVQVVCYLFFVAISIQNYSHDE